MVIWEELKKWLKQWVSNSSHPKNNMGIVDVANQKSCFFSVNFRTRFNFSHIKTKVGKVKNGLNTGFFQLFPYYRVSLGKVETSMVIVDVAIQKSCFFSVNFRTRFNFSHIKTKVGKVKKWLKYWLFSTLPILPRALGKSGNVNGNC